MKDYINHIVVIRADGKEIKGTLIENRVDRVIIRGNNNIECTVIKKHISFFICEKKLETKEELSGMHILACRNSENKDAGIYYVTNGGSMQENQDVFIKSCNLSKKKYRVIDLGDLFNIDVDLLKKVLGGTILGEVKDV